MPCVHMMEGHARQHSARELSSRLPPCRVPPSSAALTLLDCEKTILRATCEGGVAHVSIHIMRQEERGRGGSTMQEDTWHSINVQCAVSLCYRHPSISPLVPCAKRNRKMFRRQQVPCRGVAP